MLYNIHTMLFTVDDLCLSHLDNFVWFDKIKEILPSFEMVAFAIGNYKNEEPLLESGIFKEWFERHEDWVEIAVHSYDHQYPPDGDREDEEYWIAKALDSLRAFLPEDYGYRSPGWQTTNRTVPILKKLGFSYIAYESSIRDIKNEKILPKRVINAHLYNIPELAGIYNKFKEGKYEVF